MPTQLDQALDTIVTAMTAEGQPFETVPFERGGKRGRGAKSSGLGGPRCRAGAPSARVP